MISTIELRRIFAEWRLRFKRIQAILQPNVWAEEDWTGFGKALITLLQQNGSRWSNDGKQYWDLRWNLKESGTLICQAEMVENERITLIVAQSGGWVEGVESYTWLWLEYSPEGKLQRDPYWVEGTWKEALMTLLLPFQYQSGYYLAGTTATPPSLMLGHKAQES